MSTNQWHLLLEVELLAWSPHNTTTE